MDRFGVFLVFAVRFFRSAAQQEKFLLARFSVSIS
jgi:hypothetical protein